MTRGTENSILLRSQEAPTEPPSNEMSVLPLNEDVIGVIVSFISVSSKDSESHVYETLSAVAQISRDFKTHAKRCLSSIKREIEQTKRNYELKVIARAWCMDRDGVKSEFGPIAEWELGGITDMSYLFGMTEEEWDEHGMTTPTWNQFFDADLSGWDVSKVTNMKSMFEHAMSFTSDLSGWDVGQVRTMVGMFDRAASFNSDLSTWKVSNIYVMEYMFHAAESFNSNLHWDVG